MKKRGIVLALAGLMAVSAVGLSACGQTKDENSLWITYFSGGYGDDWATQLAAKFEEENPGVTVKVNPDTLLINNVPNMMQNGTSYDLIFCHDIAWEDFVQPGWIEPLDDLYAMKVEGTNQTFEERIWSDEVLSSASYIKDGVSHYYKVPWTIGTAGIAYNVTVMGKVNDYLVSVNADHTWGEKATDGTWNCEPPQDYYDLWQYCLDVIAANLKVDETDRTSDTIVPFTWSGLAEQWQWDYVVFDWWGQLAGPETMNTFKNFGNTTVDENGNIVIDWDSVSNPSSEVFNPDKNAVVYNSDHTVDRENSTYIGWKEFSQAYQLWYDLVALNKDWSLKAAGNFSKFENEQAFANGRAAMTPAACWIEYESRSYLEKSGQVVSIMATPTISNVKLDANGNVILPDETTTAATTLDAIHASEDSTHTITINGIEYDRVSFTSSFGDSAMIPAKATSKELAKKFLLFMAREDNAQLFTRVSGGTVLPYKYEYWNSFVDENGDDQATLWQKAVFDIDRNSTKFNNYTQHPMMRNTDLKGTAVMTSVWPGNQYYYYSAWQNPSNYTAEKLIGKTLYTDYVVASWDAFKRSM